MMSSDIDICFLSSKHPPKDKRVFDKEAVSLAAAGFKVVHVAPSSSQPGPDRGVDIHTYPEPRTLIDRLAQIPNLYRIGRRIDAACYHCNEVDSWFVGLLLKLSTRRKVVFDVHEIYPEEFAESRFSERFRPAVAAMVRGAIRAMIPFTDRIILAKESAGPDYESSRTRPILVRNFTSMAASQNGAGGDPTKTGRLGDRVRAVHIGGMSPERGWPQLLQALKDPRLDKIDVLLLGGFPSGGQAAFEEAAARAGLSHRFEIASWLPFAEAHRRLLECDIGLVLLQPGRLNHVHALPHKLFDYMQAELPVIAPDFAIEVARIVSEADCGILVDPSDPRAIVDALERLANDLERRKELGARGRRAVLDRYNWEREAEVLVESYVELFRDL